MFLLPKMGRQILQAKRNILLPPSLTRCAEKCFQPIMVLLTVICFSFLAYDSRPFVQSLLNADMLLPAAFSWDLMHFPNVIRWFQFPRVIGLFPDLSVYSLIISLTGSWRLAHFGYGILSLIALTYLAGAIINKMLQCRSDAKGATIFLMIVLPILISEISVSGHATVHLYLFHPVSHGGQFLLSIAATYVAWLWIEEQQPAKYALLLFLAMSGAVSDKLFFVEFLGPLLLCAIYFSTRGLMSSAQVALIALLFAISSVASVIADQVLIHQPYPTINWVHIPNNLLKFLLSPIQITSVVPLPGLLFCGTLIVAATLVCKLVFCFKKLPTCNALVFFVFIAVGSTIGVSGVTAIMYTDVYILRYAFALLWWPLILCACWVSFVVCQCRRVRFIANATFIVLTLGTTCVVLSRGVHVPQMLSWRDPLVACIQDLQRTAGLGSGLAEFDIAPYISALSDYNLQVQQIAPNGSAVNWGFDPRWFVRSIQDPRRAPQFDFIVIAHPRVSIQQDSPFLHPSAREPADFYGLPERQIRDLYGVPSRVLLCPGLSENMQKIWSTPVQIWVYENRAELFKTLVTNSLAVQEEYIRKGISVCISPRLLFGGDYVSEDRNRIITNVNGSSSWGPYINIPRGRIVIRLIYRLQRGQEPLGARSLWAVTADHGKRELFTGVLGESGVKFEETIATVELEDDSNIEIVTRLGGEGYLIIKAVGIVPIADLEGRGLSLGREYRAALDALCG